MSDDPSEVPSGGFALSASHETSVPEFESGGPRSVQFLRRASQRWPHGWVVAVDPAVPDSRGEFHSEVVLGPYRESLCPDLREIEPGAYADVWVGPAGSAETDEREWAWYVGGLARSVEDLPPTGDQVFEREFAALQTWVDRTGDPNPRFDATIDGVEVGRLVHSLKNDQQGGGLPGDRVVRLEAIPGWEWWDSDVIDLIAKFAEREGHCDVPDGHLEDGRPVASRWQAESYLKALEYKGKIHDTGTARFDAAEIFMPVETRQRGRRGITHTPRRWT